MKFKATKKEMKNGYNKILSVSYCTLQNLLKYSSPIAYSVRFEGWVCDYYIINGLCISTGYSTIGNKVDYSILKKYDDLAMQCYDKIQIDALLSQFTQEVITLI